MSNEVIELAEFKLASGKTEADLIAASERFQKDFLESQSGFISRHLTRMSDGQYADVIVWRDMAAAEAIMAQIENSLACADYFSVMALNPENPSEGVSHFQVLKIYKSAM